MYTAQFLLLKCNQLCTLGLKKLTAAQTVKSFVTEREGSSHYTHKFTTEPDLEPVQVSSRFNVRILYDTFSYYFFNSRERIEKKYG
jgi:hypothetical protein